MKPLKMNKINIKVTGPLGDQIESHYLRNEEGLAIIGFLI
jgi:hypothetical protein